MKGFLLFVFGLLCLILIIYLVPSWQKNVSQLLSYSQCDSPMGYKIGSIDARFGLSSNDALTDIQEATSIWSDAYHKNLFAFSNDANLTVNFVYDKRQELDTKITSLSTQLQQNNEQLQQQIASYKADVTAFEKRLKALNETINKYNSEGGAPQAVYADLVKQQNQLKAEGDALNARARELNLSTNDYNASVANLNQDVTQFNAALAQKPEEGLFEYNNGVNTITIYFASNRQELLHTLAHEFGHALGMMHVQNPEAIMYPYTTSVLAVSPDDESQLRSVCQKQSLFIHWFYVLQAWLALNLQKTAVAPST